MSSIFNALLTRCTRTAFASREDIVQCTVALLELCKFEKNIHSINKYSAPIKRFARREKNIINEAVNVITLDGFNASNGVCAVLLSQTLADEVSSLHLLDTVRCKVIESTQTALLEQTWPLQHLRIILYNVSRLWRGGLDNITITSSSSSNNNVNNSGIPHSFFTSFAHFIANRVEITCFSFSTKSSEPTSSSLIEEHVNDLSLLISMATLLPSEERTTTMQLIAKHTASLADVLPITTLGHLCAVFNKYKEQSELLAVAMQEEADRIANDGDAFAVVHAFRFIGAHKEEVLSSEALQWLMERLISEEFDAESLVQICHTLCHLPQAMLYGVASEWKELISALCMQMTEILTELSECAVSISSNNGNDCDVSDSSIEAHTIVEQLILITKQLIELRIPLEQLLLLELSKESGKQLLQGNQVKNEQSQLEQVPERLQEKEEEEWYEEECSSILRGNLTQQETSANNVQVVSTTNANANVFNTQEEESTTVTFPESYTVALNKCVDAFSHNASKFAHLGDAQLQELIDQLMEASKISVLAPLREASISLLQIFASRNTPIPIAPLRVFQYMTYLCNVPFFGDGVVCAYFLKYFSKKILELSIMQLCTTLKSFAWALQTLPVAHTSTKINASNTELCQELVEIELAPFLRLCAESVWRHCSEGVSIRCMLCIIAHMHLLGYKDDIFYKSCIKYLTLKIKAGATANEYCPHTVNVVRDALHLHNVEINDTLTIFFKSVYVNVTDKDSSYNKTEENKSVNELCMTPEEWIKTFDYNYCNILRSESSLQCVQLLDEMITTRSDEGEKIRELGTKYVEHITSALPCDHVTFFSVFATKVLKEDKLLKLCLEKLVERELVNTLSGHQIASILNSLSTVHCIYVVSIKKFLNSMKVEQWNEMEMADVVRLLDACSRLCIRVPAIIDRTCKRLTELSIFLSPIQLANAIYSLQALGCANQEVLQSLIVQASKNAKRFDEASISTLFSVPSFHRLIRTPEIATPLLHQACSKISSAQRRRRIALNLRQSSLPRTLIESQTSRLLAITDSSARASMLLLQASKK